MWQSITDPERSRRCWKVIEEIERCLLEYTSLGASDPRRAQDPSLANGAVGLALFFAYLDAARPGSGAAERALDILGQGIDALTQSNISPSLYSGFSGIGWVVCHLTREFFEGDDDLTSEIDTALDELLSLPADNKPPELISGLSGYGVYLLERPPHADAVGLLGRILDHLEQTVEVSPAGCTWHTSPEWLADWQRALRPEGCYDLGVAHGVPGVIGFLAAAHSAGISDPRVSQLADGAVRWLLSQRLPDGGDSAFPALLVPGFEPEPTRMAWCYGDLGIAVVLLSAARSFDRADWEREALSLARLAARRSVEAVRASDACLCHGTAGLSQLFQRLYHATGDPVMKEAALAWLERTLEIRRPGEGIAGFLTWIGGENGRRGSWEGHSGFLVGVAGIGLVLLAAVTDVEPAWDRVLLTAVPPDSGLEIERPQGSPANSE